MSQEAERVYTINLGKVWLSPDNQRAKRAINMIKEFAAHHMKTEQIKVDQDLSQAVWKRGIRSPPRKIRVKMAKTDEGYVLVSTYEEETKASEEKTEEKAKGKKAKKQPEPKAEKALEEPKAKVEEPKVKPEPKAEKAPEEPKKEPKKESKPKKEEKKKAKGKKPAKKSK